MVLNVIYALAPFLIMSAFYFINLLGGQLSGWIIRAANYLALLIASVFVVLFFTSNDMIRSITDYSHYETGPLFGIYTIYVIILFVGLLGLLIWRYHKGDKKYKEQIKLFGIGLAFVVIVSSIVGFVLPSMGISKYNVLDSPSSIVLVLLTAYAIMKEHLMDLKTATVEIIAYFIVISMGLALFSTQEIGFVIKVFLEILTIVAANMLVQKNKQQILYAEKNEKLARQLEHDKKELVELDRMKDEFLQMATHELNTPITAIQGRMDMAIRENMCKLDDEQKAYFQPILDQVMRLAHLSKDVLNVARIDQHRLTINPIETDIDPLISQIVSSLEIKTKEKGNSIAYIPMSRSLPKLTIDQSKIGEVVTNLINNANKFTNNGKIAVTSKLKDDKVVISVADTGIGIEKEDQKHLFEKFYQAGRFDPRNPQEQQGSGLGLYISKNIINLHGGDMWLESDKDKGSTFYFSLPLEYKEIRQATRIHSDGTNLRVL